MDYQHLNAGQKGKGRSVVDSVEIPPIPIETHLQKGAMEEDVQNFASGQNPDCLFSGNRSTRNICNYMFFLLSLLFLFYANSLIDTHLQKGAMEMGVEIFANGREPIQ